ncbi:MAG: nitronate monooxygenase [Pseudomonadota bacterium]
MFSFDDLKTLLIQAPMAGGPSTPALVAAVANAGGVGSYGFAYSGPEKIAADLSAAASLIDRSAQGAVNANFFVFSPVEVHDESILDAALGDLADSVNTDALEFQYPKPPYFPELELQLEAVWDNAPEILTFHFGIPSSAVLQRAKERGIYVGITATNLEEARAIESAGADFVVAQGIEAGGHRGVFDQSADDTALSANALLRELRDEVSLPLVAAGGIMNRMDIDAALNAGARAVQMGTAFLTTHESGASAAHKRYLLDGSGRGTCLTRGFSGRTARGIENSFTTAMEGKSVMPFPLQNTLTGKMRARATADDDGEFQSLWAGTGLGQCRAESASEVIDRLFNASE